jgi:hypothetical protein
MTNEESREETPDSEPKIVVDSDWKEQVAREKEQAAEEKVESQRQDAADEPSGAADSKPPSGSTPPPPQASFEVLAYSLFAQAMSSLGQSIDPEIPQGSVNKPYAKHYIDTLEMLSEKTSGNLSDDESTMLNGILHTLRMAYVNVK